MLLKVTWSISYSKYSEKVNNINFSIRNLLFKYNVIGQVEIYGKKLLFYNTKKNRFLTLKNGFSILNHISLTSENYVNKCSMVSIPILQKLQREESENCTGYRVTWKILKWYLCVVPNLCSFLNCICWSLDSLETLYLIIVFSTFILKYFFFYTLISKFCITFQPLLFL